MEILIFLLAMSIYVMVGGFLSAILGWDEGDESLIMTCFWPLITPIVFLVALARYSMMAGTSLVKLIYKFKRRKTK